MPQSDLDHPPPAKPAMAKEIESLRIIIHAIKGDLIKRRKEYRGKPGPLMESSLGPAFAV
jgi:hypothetical protein